MPKGYNHLSCIALWVKPFYDVLLVAEGVGGCLHPISIAAASVINYFCSFAHRALSCISVALPVTFFSALNSL